MAKKNNPEINADVIASKSDCVLSSSFAPFHSVEIYEKLKPNSNSIPRQGNRNGSKRIGQNTSAGQQQSYC
jgi:hypothetical protein